MRCKMMIDENNLEKHKKSLKHTNILKNPDRYISCCGGMILKQNIRRHQLTHESVVCEPCLVKEPKVKEVKETKVKETKAKEPKDISKYVCSSCYKNILTRNREIHENTPDHLRSIKKQLHYEELEKNYVPLPIVYNDDGSINELAHLGL